MLYKNMFLALCAIFLCTATSAYSAHPIAVIINNNDCGFFTAEQPFKENTEALYTWLFQSIPNPDCPPLIVSKHLIHALMLANYIFNNIVNNEWDFDTFYNNVAHLPYLQDKATAQKQFDNLTLFTNIISDYTAGNSQQCIHCPTTNSHALLDTSHNENKNSVQFYLCAYLIMQQSFDIFDAAPSLYIILKKNNFAKNFQNLPYPKIQKIKPSVFFTYTTTSSQDLATMFASTFTPYLKNAFIVLIGHGKSQTEEDQGVVAGFSHNALKNFIQSLTTAQTLVIITCHAGGINSLYIPTKTPCDILVFSGVENTQTGVLSQCIIDVQHTIACQDTFTLPQNNCNWSHFKQQLENTHKYTPQTYVKLIATIAPYLEEDSVVGHKIYLFKNKFSQKPACPLPCPEITYISQKKQQRTKELVFQDATTPSVIILEPILIEKPITLLSTSKMPDIIIFDTQFLHAYCSLQKVTAPNLDFKNIINGFLAHKSDFRRIFLLKNIKDKTSTKHNVLIATYIKNTQNDYSNFVLYYDTRNKRYHYLSWPSQSNIDKNALPSDYQNKTTLIKQKTFNNYYKKIMLNTVEHKNMLKLQRQLYKEMP